MSGKLVAECPECQYVDPTITPASYQTGIVSTGSSGPGWSGKQVQRVDISSGGPVPAAPSAAAQPTQLPSPLLVPSIQGPGPIPVVTPGNPGDVLAMIQARTLWLGSEEARLEGVVAAAKSQLASARAEKTSLTKMLRAAGVGVTTTNGTTAPASVPETTQN